MVTESRSVILTSLLQRDYCWNVSRAILMAKERIMIHDWWLSPGLLMSTFYDRVSSCHHRGLSPSPGSRTVSA